MNLGPPRRERLDLAELSGAIVWARAALGRDAAYASIHCPESG